jgi:3-hydroxyisobutyrate dehydrogenase-like beta-hydroxyacid dehydrogenase
VDSIGFIGLGAMGSAMARNIHNSGYSLGVYNRTRSATEAFRELGASVCDSPKQTAGRSDITIIMVTGPDALDAVINGPDGVAAGLTAGKTVINMSTVSPEATEAAAAAVTAKGADFVDAPVSGSVKPAEDAALTVLAGGSSTVLSRVMPVLKSMAKEIIECGAVGQGTRMKLVLNLMLGNMMQSLAEAVTLGRGFGLDIDAILRSLGSGPMAAPMYQLKGKAIEAGNFASQFPVHLMFKDLNLVLDAAGNSHTPLPQTAATRECFNTAMARGLGSNDMAAVVKVLELLAAR